MRWALLTWAARGAQGGASGLDGALVAEPERLVGTRLQLYAVRGRGGLDVDVEAAAACYTCCGIGPGTGPRAPLALGHLLKAGGLQEHPGGWDYRSLRH